MIRELSEERKLKYSKVPDAKTDFFDGFMAGALAERERVEKKLKKSQGLAGKMKIFKIWLEGYAVTNGHRNASYYGEMEGYNFQDACDVLFRADPDWNTYDQDYDSVNLTLYGHRLFDNEKQAREAFG